MISSRCLILAYESLGRQCPPFLRGSIGSCSVRRLGPCQIFQFLGYTASPHYKNKRPYKLLPLVDKSLQSRSWSNYIVPAALLVICGAGMLIRHNDERRAIVKGSHQGSAGNERRTVNRPAIGGPFSLINTEFQLMTEHDLRGNWVLMYFGYTSSPDVDPEELQKMSRAVEILEMEQNLKIKPVFITIDPERDSPSHLRAYLREFDPRIVGLTGSIAAVRQMAQEYRVYFKKVEEVGEDYLIESSHNVYLMDPNTEIVRVFGVEYDAEQLANGILKEFLGFIAFMGDRFPYMTLVTIATAPIGRARRNLNSYRRYKSKKGLKHRKVTYLAAFITDSIGQVVEPTPKEMVELLDFGDVMPQDLLKKFSSR